MTGPDATPTPKRHALDITAEFDSPDEAAAAMQRLLTALAAAGGGKITMRIEVEPVAPMTEAPDAS